MDINVKVNVDADTAIEKLERIRDLYKEINDLKQEDVNISIGYFHNGDGLTPRKSETCSMVCKKDGLYVKYPNGKEEKIQSFQESNIKFDDDIKKRTVNTEKRMSKDFMN